nr:4191_t:CDS:10 [Entrophospora candida]
MIVIINPNFIMQPVFRNIKFVELNPKTIPKLEIPCFEYVSIKLSLLKKDDTFNVYLMVLPSVEVKDDEIGLPNWISKFLDLYDSKINHNNVKKENCLKFDHIKFNDFMIPDKIIITKLIGKVWLPKFLKQEDSSRTNNLLLDYEEIIKRNLDGTLVSNNSLFNIKIMNNECIFIIKSIIINDDNNNKIVDNKIYKVNKNITKIEIRLNNNNINDLDLLSNKVNDEDESSSDIDGGWKSRIINSLIKEIQNINETDKMTNGYVSEDIYNLCRLTLMHSLNNQTNNDGENEDVNNIINNMSKININAGGNNKNFKIDWEDFNYGLSMMKPLGKFGTDKIPINLNLNDDIGGYEAIKKKLIKIIEFSLINNGKNDGNYNLLGVRPLTGLLLYGPSGCGKTILIQTIAKELNINLIYIKSPEIYSKYLGETEKFLRNLFKKSKQISCIIFFDEIDSIGTKRDWESNESSVGINERVLSTLLNEIDGIQELKNVLIIGCTNNPEQLDDALIRPDDRLNILKVLSRKFSLGEDVDLKKLAELTERFSGADLEKLFR